MSAVEIEWDERKRSAIWRARGIDIARAALILTGPTVQAEDRRHDYGEARYIAIGKIEDEYYTIVYTRRPDAIRIITGWKTGRRARQRYDSYLLGGAA